MQEWIIQIMDQLGYLGVCALIAIENIFPPIPSEIILTFGGFMTTYTRLTVPGTIIFATLGSGIGAIVLYWIGTCLTPAKLEALLEKRNVQRIGFDARRVGKAVRWFDRHGKAAIFLGRCVPIVRSLISIPAGMAQIRLPLFLTYTLAGSLIWNTVLISLGAALGASWETVVFYVDRYSELVLGLLAAGLVFYAVRRFFHNRT